MLTEKKYYSARRLNGQENDGTRPGIGQRLASGHAGLP